MLNSKFWKSLKKWTEIYYGVLILSGSKPRIQSLIDQGGTDLWLRKESGSAENHYRKKRRGQR
jgi:hypothetical protein